MMRKCEQKFVSMDEVKTRLDDAGMLTELAESVLDDMHQINIVAYINADGETVYIGGENG